MKKDKKQEADEFWERMHIIMGTQNPYTWCKDIGIVKGTFQSSLERKTKPLDKTLDKWAKKIGCNPLWLKTGVGEPWGTADVDDHVAAIIASANNPVIADEDENTSEILIPVYDVKLCCGDGSQTFDFEPLKKVKAFSHDFFVRKKRKSEDCILLYAMNDSMQNYICDGDMVMIDKSVTTPKDGNVYAVWFEGEAMFKRIYKEAGGKLILSSDNKEYRERQVTEENGAQFRIIGEQFYRSG